MPGRKSDRSGLWEADSLHQEHMSRASFYGLFGLAVRVIVRDEDFAGLLHTDNGRESVPPSLLRAALVLYTNDRMSDGEDQDRAGLDLRP